MEAVRQGETTLPAGQREIKTFPRFGLMPFADRFPSATRIPTVHIGGDVATPVNVSTDFQQASRVEQCSDFHCVTTWTYRGLRWGGIRFQDFYQQVVVPRAGPSADATFVVLRGQDGARASLPLEDLLAHDVLLADRLNDEPLSIAHGAPLRLVAPAHYGYKSVKHVHDIEFWRDSRKFRPVGFRFMVHPRARVAHEERGRWIPGWVLRYLYRPLIHPTTSRFERSMQVHLASQDSQELHR